MHVDKVVVSVRDAEAMRRFYQQTFGLEFSSPMPGQPGFAVASAQGLTLVLCPAAISGVDVSPNSVQVRFVVDDVAACRARALAAGGATISDQPRDEGGLRCWDFRDPDGNSIEVREG